MCMCLRLQEPSSLPQYVNCSPDCQSGSKHSAGWLGFIFANCFHLLLPELYRLAAPWRNRCLATS